MTDEHIRQAAESLLSSVSDPVYRPLSPKLHSLPAIRFVSANFEAGIRLNGKMSKVRRMFCTFLVFDLLFTVFMWLICVMMRGETVQKIYSSEILNYNISKSLFDIVMLSVIRFSLLLLFYACLHIDSWILITLSTSVTCIFLMAKVFVFDWVNAVQPVFEVLLIMATFVLAWAETWFLDYRVLPQEAQAKDFLDFMRSYQDTVERTPLINHCEPSGAQSTAGESIVNWFSPIQTPESSPTRCLGPDELFIFTQEQIDEYKAEADQSLRDAWRIINLPNWKLEKRGNYHGDIVESKHVENIGKVYRFTGTVECPSKYLFEEFRDNLTKLPEWNPTILKNELIKQICPGYDLSYQVTAGGGRGIVAPRDFVILRRTTALNSDGNPTDDENPYCYITSGISVDVPGYPPRKDIVRGYNKVGCWFLMPTRATAPGSTLHENTVFQWLMCCDLKGKIPQFILDVAFSTVMLDYIVYVRRFVADAQAKGLF